MWNSIAQKKTKKTFKYDNNTTFEDRKKETDLLIQKNPTRVPLLIEYIGSDSSIEIDKCKYSVPKDSLVSVLMIYLKQKLKMDAQSALFMFIDNNVPSICEKIGTLYDKHKSSDGYLRITYTKENTFG
jgi:GABA(A) receptor-associated protein